MESEAIDGHIVGYDDRRAWCPAADAGQPAVRRVLNGDGIGPTGVGSLNNGVCWAFH